MNNNINIQIRTNDGIKSINPQVQTIDGDGNVIDLPIDLSKVGTEYAECYGGPQNDKLWQLKYIKGKEENMCAYSARCDLKQLNQDVGFFNFGSNAAKVGANTRRFTCYSGLGQVSQNVGNTIGNLVNVSGNYLSIFVNYFFLDVITLDYPLYKDLGSFDDDETEFHQITFDLDQIDDENKKFKEIILIKRENIDVQANTFYISAKQPMISILSFLIYQKTQLAQIKSISKLYNDWIGDNNNNNNGIITKTREVFKGILVTSVKNILVQGCKTYYHKDDKIGRNYCKITDNFFKKIYRELDIELNKFMKVFLEKLIEYIENTETILSDVGGINKKITLKIDNSKTSIPFYNFVVNSTYNWLGPSTINPTKYGINGVKIHIIGYLIFKTDQVDLWNTDYNGDQTLHTAIDSYNQSNYLQGVNQKNVLVEITESINFIQKFKQENPKYDDYNIKNTLFSRSPIGLGLATPARGGNKLESNNYKKYKKYKLKYLKLKQEVSK